MDRRRIAQDASTEPRSMDLASREYQVTITRRSRGVISDYAAWKTQVWWKNAPGAGGNGPRKIPQPANHAIEYMLYPYRY